MNNAEHWVVEYTRNCKAVERIVVTGRHAVGNYALDRLVTLSDWSNQNMREFLEGRPLSSKHFAPQNLLDGGFTLYSGTMGLLDWVRVAPLFKAK